MRIGILIPHVFAQQNLVGEVVFSPISLAVDLVNGLVEQGHDVYFFTPGPVDSNARNINVDMTLLNKELEKQGCSLPELITESPLGFISLSRSIQSELTAEAFRYCNLGKLDVLHVYVCENEEALYYADLLNVPVVYTHHDPYNFYRQYRVRFPRVKNLNYVSISMAQRKTAPRGMNFIANVYNGIDLSLFKFNNKPGDYFCYIGRIIQTKGVHTAIDVCLKTGEKFKFAGKYYSSGDKSEDYWTKYIKPKVDNRQIVYEGFISDPTQKSDFLGKARAMLLPVEWDEPFGVVIIESMACGTPVIAFNQGAVPEIIKDGVNGFVVKNIDEMQQAMKDVDKIDRKKCRKWVEENFTVEKMVDGYEKVYNGLLKN